MRKKLKISELKLKSFVTDSYSHNDGTVKGGRWSLAECPHTGSTMGPEDCGTMNGDLCSHDSIIQGTCENMCDPFGATR